MKTIEFYQIRTISNLHAGSGEGDFSIVDKQVQRDAVTKLPVIHASGIKGALREAMTVWAKQQSDAATHLKTVTDIFGSEPKDDAQQGKGKRDPKKMQQGLNNFFAANLLALPIRSNRDFFYRATCPQLLTAFRNMLTQFDLAKDLGNAIDEVLKDQPVKNNPTYFGKEKKGLRLEDWKACHQDSDVGQLESVIGKRMALLTNEDFMDLADQLPVLARNYLNNGISENLWYEEVVPRESVFYTMIARPTDNVGLQDFLTRQNNLVQIGANATVGYGLCHFNKMFA